MFIIIDPSCANVIGSEYIDQFEEFLRLHAKGVHYIGGYRKTILDMKHKLNGKLADKSMKILEMISTQSPHLSSILKVVKVYVVLRLDVGANIRLISNDDVLMWEMGLEAANKWLSHPLKIYGENLLDSKLLSAAGKQFCVANDGFKFNDVYSHLEHTGGSGNAPAIIRQKIFEAASPILLCIDSDKYSPSHIGSSAIRECKNIVDSNSCVVLFFPLEEREMENVVSLDVLKQAVLFAYNHASSDRDNLLEKIDFLKSLREECEDLYKYLDIKHGTCNCWVSKTGNVVSDLYSRFTPNPPGCGKEGCEGFFSPPLCANILEKLWSYFEVMNQSDAKKSFAGEGETWRRLGATVFAMSFRNATRVT